MTEYIEKQAAVKIVEKYSLANGSVLADIRDWQIALQVKLQLCLLPTLCRWCGAKMRENNEI